jgi:3-dehydroquinate dehydratase-2
VRESDRSRRRLLLVNGPNLNLLGSREPDVYGLGSLEDVEETTRNAAARFGFEVRAVQSNHEGVLLDAIHEAGNDCVGVVINAGAYSHTSIALRDALTAVALPVAEVHISNVYRREEFRHHSYISAVADVVILGAGISGYAFAVEHLARMIG